MAASNRGRPSGPLASVLKSSHPGGDKLQAGKGLFLSDASASPPVMFDLMITGCH